MNRIQLARNFTLDELTRSATARRLGLPNRPDAHQVAKLRQLAAECLQPIRDRFGPVVVLSGYRCPDLNRAVGSSEYSAHLHGLAADISVPGHSPAEVIRWAKEHLTAFDQLIDEFGDWIHVGLLRPRDGRRRRQVLHARSQGGKAVYRSGLEGEA